MSSALHCPESGCIYVSISENQYGELKCFVFKYILNSTSRKKEVSYLIHLLDCIVWKLLKGEPRFQNNGIIKRINASMFVFLYLWYDDCGVAKTKLLGYKNVQRATIGAKKIYITQSKFIYYINIVFFWKCSNIR